MDHPDKNDFTYNTIFELLSKYPQVVEPFIKIEIKNIDELCKKFIIVDGEWRLLSS